MIATIWTINKYFFIIIHAKLTVYTDMAALIDLHLGESYLSNVDVRINMFWVAAWWPFYHGRPYG